MASDALRNGFVRERRRYAVLAAALIVLLSGYNALLSLSTPDSAFTAGAREEALLLSGILAAVSGGGIVAAARPSQCIGLLTPRRRTETADPSAGTPEGVPSFPLVAHHCTCGRFVDHTVRVGGRTFCAGCLGMAIGGAFGIGIAVALAVGLLFLVGIAALAMALLGTAASAAGLALLVHPSPGRLHTAANIAFVAGTVLLAALLSSHGFAAGGFGVLAALALVGLRIEMSRWRHLSIYAECPWLGACRGTTALAAARRATRR